MRIISRIQIAVKAALILWFVIVLCIQRNTRLADNGDFTRSMGWISTGPIGIEPNWPSVGTEDWSKRFFNDWIPLWKLEWKMTRPATSAFYLWLPGALLNYILYSKEVLSLAILSFFPKFILFGMLLLLLNWITLETRYTTILLFSMGAPIILILTTADYAAYLNSFYQESASFVFFFSFFVSLLLLNQRSSFLYLLCSLFFILLLATAQAANLYWPLLAIPFVFYGWSLKKTVRARTSIAVSVTLIIFFISASAFVTKAGSMRANPYHSLFYGVLTFSDIPSAHLKNLGMADAVPCINTSAYDPAGSACFTKYQIRMSFKNTIRVICKEPLVVFRMLKYTLVNMQDVSLDYLGKYSFDDQRNIMSPRITSPCISNLPGIEKRLWLSAAEPTPLNLWAKLKFKFFPTGYTLFFVLVGFVIWFISRFKCAGIHQTLALVGLMSTVACVAAMTIAVLGDGKYELIRHLFMSNILFDIATIVFLNSVLLYCIELAGRSARCGTPQ